MPHQNTHTMELQAVNATVREIRKILFDNDYYAVIGADEHTNKEARDILYAMDNQEQVFNYAINKNCVYIWNI